MSDPWATFADPDEWDDFKDDTPVKSAPVVSSSPSFSPPSLGMDSLVGVVDGDTFRQATGPNVRLWGVDAPELRQQGWNRQGVPVAIGKSSQTALAQLVAGGGLKAGEAVSSSYGRPVAPVTGPSGDIGKMMLRGGNALAAPDYLKADPERRFDYMQAERLARRNRLGIHGTMFQEPAEFRKAPMPMPSREAVAQFWDTPTPQSGLRPEAEKRATELLYDPAVPLDEVASYIKANGGVLDMDSARASREWAAKSGERMPYAYTQEPRVLTDSGDGVWGATVRGFGSGVLASGLDEVGAIADTFGMTDGRENVFNSDRRLADIWSNNQDQNSAILGFDNQEHPYAATTAQIAGGLVVPFGAQARTVPQLFRVGAAYGGAEGFMGTDGGFGERSIGGAIGVPVGGALGAVGGKALEYALPLAQRALQGRGGRIAEQSGEAVEGYAGEAVPGRAQDMPAHVDGFDEFPDDVPIAYKDVPAVTRNERSIGMDAEPMPWLSAEPRQPDYLDMGPVRPGRMDQPLTDAQRSALAQDIQPRDVLPILSNEIADVEEAAAISAGRFAPARPVNEMTALESRTFRSANGKDIAKRGPVDLVTWLRTEGGIKDQGGNLRAMGIDNRPRDFDLARGEQRLGKLVDDDNGMNLDDAAFKAWEAGYLPGTERPDVNTLLDAIDRTHSGAERFFHPDDLDEVARFEGMKDERIALEEQLQGGPVHVDRSVPADEPQPFAPPEAYEEWPAGGVDFAGNINLSKLDSPQDIARALDMTERRVGFGPGIRGRVSWAETERLASELNLTPDRLLSRRKGQAFNAEEALAARQLLAKSGNELVNAARKVQAFEQPGDEILADFRHKWTRHVAIQEQVSGMTAEAGRALQQFRMTADSRAIRGDVLSAMVRGGGGPDNLRNAAEILLDAAETSPGKFNALAVKASHPKWRNRVGELYINFLLSNPATHVVNSLSNTLTSIAQIPEHIAAGAIGKARQILPGANIDRVTGTEIGQRVFGLVQGAKEGALAFGKALRTGEPEDFMSKVEGQEYHAIPGKIGTVIRMPTRFLTAEDELFKGIARRMELNGLAARQANSEGLRGEAATARIAELIEDPTDEMLAGADEYGRYLTFQTRLEGLARDVSNLSQRNIVSKLFLPFVRTPTNLVKFATERSPAAPMVEAWRKDFLAGGARRDTAIAKAVAGSGFGALFYQAAQEGLITGSAPSDPKKTRLLYADGWQPHSIRIGDTYYSYKRLDPFAMTLDVAADLATLPEGMSERQREEGATLVVASILGNMASKTWLTGVSDLVGALYEPDRNADRMIQRLAGSLLVPAGVAGLARTIDPTAREVETVGDALKARVPGMSSTLLPRRDVWGEEIRSEGGVGPDIMSPVYTSTARNNPVNRELLGIEYAPGKPGNKIGGQELAPEQYDRYQEIAGRESFNAMGRLVASPEWKAMDVEERQKAAQKVVRDSRETARSQLFGGGKTPTKSKPVDDWDAFDDAPGQKAARDPWSDFADPDQRDVVGNLQRAIPGIRMTSGYRNEAYQADMRRRGYNPASNSAHLDGSSLDLLPPPGRSISWLRARMALVEPDARLLSEGDHLHATFPGWYGAPVIGGARKAGLHNPMAGR